MMPSPLRLPSRKYESQTPKKHAGSTSLLLWLLRWEFHVLGRDGNRCAILRHIDMGRPKDAVHDGPTKSLFAEVVVKMAAHEAERASAVGVGPFVDPADRIVCAFNDRGHHRPGFGQEAELE